MAALALSWAGAHSPLFPPTVNLSYHVGFAKFLAGRQPSPSNASLTANQSLSTTVFTQFISVQILRIRTLIFHYQSSLKLPSQQTQNIYFLPRWHRPSINGVFQWLRQASHHPPMFPHISELDRHRAQRTQRHLPSPRRPSEMAEPATAWISALWQRP
ncbi:hypothetical protein Sp245p_17340 (plasmid) [Azospirillum baldaniorum]|uniref:Uncharacterized protein n=1 Tax=Azospirillum baldaniorum TaxID=1064539 RepID=A0A9P1JUE5_9PROT|nr:hypothetical protein Sp245p_17340 [Azospirillum baldaniorum]CCC99923.1 protein of unknown function [Azospirillum baldaniorum]